MVPIFKVDSAFDIVLYGEFNDPSLLSLPLGDTYFTSDWENILLDNRRNKKINL